MSGDIPTVSQMEEILNEVIGSLVDEIMIRHVKAAQEEIAVALPARVGAVSVKIIQEMSRSNPIEPRFTINVIHNSGGKYDG